MAPRARRARLRIGFASAFFHVGTVGRYFCNWVTELDRERFEVYVYHLFPGIDEVAAPIERRADSFRSYGGSRCRPTVVAPDIRGDELDVLIYPELGMDVTSFALAGLRLAPRQYAAWGHPVTTGHPTIDGFFTCAAMEPDDCEAHYTEPLIKLPGIGTRYLRPKIPPPVERRELGLPGDPKKLLLCPQSLFKIHPDNDELFARVLADNPEALLILFAGRHPAITDQYMRRLTRACERHGLAIRERTRVLPSLPHAGFLAVNLACDAMLDTLHWSGGNTSLDALACGLPMVTLPGAYMRGRQSAGMLSLLGVTELIARDKDDYVRIAARLIREPAWRRALAERITAAQDRLFDASEAIDRLQEFLQAAPTAAT
jgi:CRISPR-associated protein Csy1